MSVLPVLCDYTWDQNVAHLISHRNTGERIEWGEITVFHLQIVLILCKEQIKVYWGCSSLTQSKIACLHYDVFKYLFVLKKCLWLFVFEYVK